MTLKMAFQSIFLIAAYAASLELKPKLDPEEEDYVPFTCLKKGMKIEARLVSSSGSHLQLKPLHVRNISYTYPGALEPALQNISFTLDAGQSLAIVGVNGSGQFCAKPKRASHGDPLLGFY